MAYRKRYEDSYLDEDEENLEDGEMSDAERIVRLLHRGARTPKEDERMVLLTNRLFVGAKLPGPVGVQAQHGLQLVADAYAQIGLSEAAAALWVRISELAGEIGNKDLYYRALDEMAQR